VESDAGIRDQPGRWPVTASRYLHRDDWVVALREDELHRPGHPEEPFPRLVVEHPGAVIVLAVDDREQACCLRHYRHAAGGTFVEIPAGIRDTIGEEPLETARRELREEVELEAHDWRHLLTLRPRAGISAEEHVVFLARDLHHADRGGFALRHEEAEMEVLWVPMPRLLEAVLAGDVTEAPLVAAVLAYDVLAQRGRL
jgi:ADP-ribose pyrophosphatase